MRGSDAPGVYVPDEAIAAVLEEWLAAKRAQSEAEERERAVWERLNALLDGRLGEGAPAVFVMGSREEGLAQPPPWKAGRAYPLRGGGTDYQRLALLVKERLGDYAYRRYFVAERVTRYLPNEQSIAAAAERDGRMAAIVRECTSEGEAVLTRVPPAKASRELAAAAVPLPMPRRRRSRDAA